MSHYGTPEKLRALADQKGKSVGAAKEAALRDAAATIAHLQIEIETLRSEMPTKLIENMGRRAVHAQEESARLRDHLSQALRQWRMYAEMQDERDLSKDPDVEAKLYRELLAAISSGKLGT